MTNKMKLIWRLGKLPTVSEIQELVKDKIITQDEAREILFNLEDEVDRDKKSLESEIKFLRELVDKLSQSRSNIITTIREIEVPYRQHPWYLPYIAWCDSGGNYTNAGIGSSTCITTASFSDVRTF